MTRTLLGPALALALAAPALADEFVVRPSGSDFDDTAFAVESAILGRGLVIDLVSRVGEMLERTRADIGSDRVLFAAADVYVFCSASVSRQVMEADPMNFGFCPYGIHVFDAGEGVMVGYMHRSAPSMAPVNALLESIVAEALD